MIQDTVTDEVLLRKPKFIAFLFSIILLCFFIIDPSQSIMGELLEPALGDPEKSGIYGHFITSFMLSALLVLNLLAISFIPRFRFQVIVVWVQLLILFLGLPSVLLHTPKKKNDAVIFLISCSQIFSYFI